MKHKKKLRVLHVSGHAERVTGSVFTCSKIHIRRGRQRDSDKEEDKVGEERKGKENGIKS